MAETTILVTECDDDGAVLSRVTDKASWEATLARYCDIGCSKPRASFKMTGVVEH